MRRVIWSGIAGVMTGAAMMYLVTGYVSRHPDSLLANCAGIAQRVGVELNPIYRLGKAMAARTSGPTPATEDGQSMEEEAASVPDEPHPVDALLPDPAKLGADWQPFETIDLLKAQGTPALARPEEPGKQPPPSFSNSSPPSFPNSRSQTPVWERADSSLGTSGVNPAREEMIPAAVIRAADEAECFRLMPYWEETDNLATMPFARDSDKPIIPCTSLVPKLPFGNERGEERPGTDELLEHLSDPKAVEQRLRGLIESYLKDGKCPGRSGADTMEFRPSDAKKGEFDRIPF